MTAMAKPLWLPGFWGGGTMTPDVTAQVGRLWGALLAPLNLGGRGPSLWDMIDGDSEVPYRRVCPHLSIRPGPPSLLCPLGSSPDLLGWVGACESVRAVGCPPRAAAWGCSNVLAPSATSLGIWVWGPPGRGPRVLLLVLTLQAVA